MKKLYCEYCGRPIAEGCNCLEAAEEEHKRFLEEYESDPLVTYGWYQQDVIDMYRGEY
jgi:hypothetical protein